MTNRHKSLMNQCSIARAGQLIGDGWTLLILRELFWGSSRYEQLAENTGMASNILAARLRKLLDHGILSKTVVADDARRFDYALTKKGLDLFPVLMTVMGWGDRWSSGDSGPLIELKHVSCGKKTKAGACCSACGEKLTPEDIRTKFSAAYPMA
jgi:DNA-binding HxlR family transcriptional regulator